MVLASFKLYTTMPSPFGRKVRMGAIICGLAERMEIVALNLADLPQSFIELAPLAKIPVLVDADGRSIYDSKVIMDWIDIQAGENVIVPRDPSARIEAQCLQALADGIADAAFLLLAEQRYRSENERSAKWIERQESKIYRGLAELQATDMRYKGGRPHVGEIALAAALGFGDSHFEGAWRPKYPGMYAWLDSFAEAVPAWEQTRVGAPP
jgi:glutathione S-transferase